MDGNRKSEVIIMADNSLTDISLDISKLKVPDLKKELKLRGLSTTGNKNELIERLQSAMKSVDSVDGIGQESVDDLEEDLLNDDDDEHLDASESVILENDLDDSPKTQKRKIEEGDHPEAKSGPPKKVVLIRNNSNHFEPTKLSEGSNNIVSVAPEGVPEKKVIKLSELTAKERLEMRAKKFGVSVLSPDAKKAVRAERFGKNSSTSNITSDKVVTSVDVLKQRAERFGGSVSSVMSSLENREKLEKRKARFGGLATNGTLSDSDKAKQRLERFKQPIK